MLGHVPSSVLWQWASQIRARVVIFISGCNESGSSMNHGFLAALHFPGYLDSHNTRRHDSSEGLHSTNIRYVLAESIIEKKNNPFTQCQGFHKDKKKRSSRIIVNVQKSISTASGQGHSKRPLFFNMSEFINLVFPCYLLSCHAAEKATSPQKEPKSISCECNLPEGSSAGCSGNYRSMLHLWSTKSNLQTKGLPAWCNDHAGCHPSVYYISVSVVFLLCVCVSTCCCLHDFRRINRCSEGKGQTIGYTFSGDYHSSEFFIHSITNQNDPLTFKTFSPIGYSAIILTEKSCCVVFSIFLGEQRMWWIQSPEESNGDNLSWQEKKKKSKRHTNFLNHSCNIIIFFTVHLSGQYVAQPDSFAKTRLNTLVLPQLSSIQESDSAGFPGCNYDIMIKKLDDIKTAETYKLIPYAIWFTVA